VTRRLAEALGARPLLFEPVPPSSRTSEDRVSAYVRRIVALLEEHPRVDAVVVPELVSENHHGEPHYRSGDVARFASEIARASGREAILNKVVAHVHSREELERWCRAALAQGSRNLMLIGGTSRYIPYPGPSVATANAQLLPLVREAGGVIGNVLIPHREHEGYRMLTKTRNGAAFFTTQIAFDPGPIADLLDEYGRLCAAYRVAPAAVLVSFAPVADEEDLDFVRWLGAEIPSTVEARLASGDGNASTAVAVETWRTVVERTARHDVAVPLGINVEVVSPRHFAVAVEMLAELEREIEHGGSS
jgi:5,10-methylenetetrahydrofolate reductase